MSMDDPAVPCDRCEESVAASKFATHPCVTPRERALTALDRAAADAATIAAHARAITETLPSQTWRAVARMADDARGESTRVSITLWAARHLARETAR